VREVSIASSSYRKAGNFGSLVPSVSASSLCLNFITVLEGHGRSVKDDKNVFTYPSGSALNSAIWSTGHSNLTVTTFAQPRQDLVAPGFVTPTG